MKTSLLFVLLSFCFSNIVFGQTSKSIQLIHTNDIQSRLLGFSPNSDYTPLSLNDDKTVGGIARAATIIRNRRADAPDETLVLDGGDFMMGTLFQTLGEEHGVELQLLQMIGYDAAVLGNHEFDFHTDGLARIIRAALKAGPIPPLLLSNVQFLETEHGDDELEKLFTKKIIKGYQIFEKNGLRIATFGLMGISAVEVAPYSKPLSFLNPIEHAKKIVATLRSKENADLIVCLSHGGVRKQPDGSWGGDDIDLAKAVPGIDVVISGHSHTALAEPILVNGTPIVQAGSEMQYVGVLEMLQENQKWRVGKYELVGINDSIPVAMDVHTMVEGYKQLIDQKVLYNYGIHFDSILMETAFDLTIEHPLKSSNLGSFAADAIAWGIDNMDTELEKNTTPCIALTTAGLLRDQLLKGEKGFQQASDLFRILPLGIGSIEESPGYPLAKVYFTASEIKSILEILILAYQLKGDSYFPYFSGLRFHYNANRVFFDRVYQVEIGDQINGYQELDLSDNNKKLYKVGANAYILNSFGLIGQLSYGILSVSMKHKDGTVVSDLSEALIDIDATRTGIQEAKEWIAFLKFANHFPDTNGNGVPDLDLRYQQYEERMIENSTWQPQLLYQNATYVMWSVSLGLFLFGLFLIWFFRRMWRKIMPKK